MGEGSDIEKPMSYKGYIIEPCPNKLADSKGWTLSVTIMRNRGSLVNDRPFHAGNIFPTREEACQHCYELGMRIIDGKVVGCSVEDL